MKCPVCERPVKETDQECECGELLTTWANIRRNGNALRQRGLVRAAEEDYVGAAISFLEAALTNPLDELSVVDAARALVHLGRGEDAAACLKHASSRPASRAPAAALVQAIEALRARQKAAAVPKEPAPAAPPPAPEPAASAPAASVPVPVALRAPLALGVLERSGRWRKLWAGKQIDPLWAEVLQREKMDEQVWALPAPWLGDTLGRCPGYGVFRYVLGLAAWQRNEVAEARQWFHNCLECSPPVLNPGAYYLCLHLETEQSAAAAYDGLRRTYSPQDTERCVQALATKLGNGGDASAYRVLRTLRASAAK